MKKFTKGDIIKNILNKAIISEQDNTSGVTKYNLVSVDRKTKTITVTANALNLDEKGSSNLSLSLPTGSKFTTTDKKNLIAKNVKYTLSNLQDEGPIFGNVIYYCGDKYFAISGDKQKRKFVIKSNIQQYTQTRAVFEGFCNSVKGTVSGSNIPGFNTTTGQYTTKFNQKITNLNNDVLTTIPNGSILYPKDKQINTVVNGKKITISCGRYNDGNLKLKYDGINTKFKDKNFNDVIAKTYCSGDNLKSLSELTKSSVTQPETSTAQETNRGGGGTSSVDTKSLITQIQAKMNLQQTGQFTEDQVLTIYNKLGGGVTTPLMSSVPLKEDINRIREIMKLIVEEPTAVPINDVNPATTYAQPGGQQPQAPEQAAINHPTIVKPETKQELQGSEKLAKPIEKGVQSSPLMSLQQLLNGKFEKNLTTDGLIGPKTAQAILDAVSTIPTTPVSTTANQTTSTTPVNTTQQTTTTNTQGQSIETI